MHMSPKRAALLTSALILVSALVAFSGSAVAATGSGLLNAGFESGLLPPSWQSAAGAAEAAVVVGVEGPSGFPVYASRDVTVAPDAGSSMLRLGTPRPKGSQPKGVTTVSQTFTPTSSTLRVAARVFSWEFRGEDKVVIDLVKANGERVGSVAQPVFVTMTDGSVVKQGVAPLTISPTSVLKSALLDTGWLNVKITGIPMNVGQLTLRYSLQTPKDSSHPTWAYFDNVNEPPTIVSWEFIAKRNTPLTIHAPGVLDGAHDPDGDVLSAWLESPPSHGRLNLQPDGSFSYAPDYGFIGSDSFTFTASDGQADSDVATVIIAVDSADTPPSPGDREVATQEDTPARIILPATKDGRALTYFVVGPPANGSVAMLAPDIEYVPRHDYYGPDSFAYYATDGLLYWDFGTVRIDVQAVNDPPVAVALDSETNLGTAVTLQLQASDPDDGSFTFGVVQDPTHGSLSSVAGDAVTYTPDSDYFGDDTFTYRALDDEGLAGEPATVTVRVKPIVAVPECLPATPLEGGVVGVFGDESYTVDHDCPIVSWTWSISGPGGFTDSFESSSSLFMPPRQGDYEVTLFVTDDGGRTASASTVVSVLNDSPRVKALDMEVLPGQPATFVGRMLDPGWEDEHTASVAFGGSQGAALDEDHVAAVSSGIVTATISASASGDGEVTVTDDGGGSASAPFDVTVVEPGADRSAAADTLADRDAEAFPKARGDGSYLSYIRSAGDVDLYEIVMPDGTDLPYGTEVLVNLKDLPADYDLAILSELPSGQSQSLQDMQDAPLDQGSVGSTWGRSVWGRSVWGRSVWGRSVWGRSVWGRSVWGRSVDDRIAALDIYTWPLSEMSFTGLENANVSGADISLSELGFAIPAETDISIAGFSANHGLQDEAALVRTESIGNRIFVAVFGANGAFDEAAPYRLQVETSKPQDLDALWGQAQPQEPLVPESQATDSDGFVGDVSPDEKLTLFVTQRERFIATYGADAWAGVLSRLETLAGHDAVEGEILSLPSDIYDPWDTKPTSVDEANALSEKIRDLIQARLVADPSLKYVVFVGDDTIVPFHRTPDDTLIGNESYYASDSWVDPSSPLFASMAHKCFLTDDYYVDAAPIPWQGRALFVPDVAISRLVEKPADIVKIVDTFLAKNGQLTPSAGFVSGYDFFADGSTAVADTMKAGGLVSVDRLVSSTWSAAELRAKLTGSTQLSGINAHYTQFAGVSAAGFAAYNLDDSFKSVEMAVPLASLEGDFVYTIGCHAGMNVPDSDALPADPSFGIDTALDFPQAMARQGATYIANTGFGLGDSEGIALSELLTQYFTEDLLQNGGATVGDALRSAKQRYILSSSALTAYDEKASGEFTLYGLPQYKINTGAGPLATSGGGSAGIQAAGLAWRMSSANSTAPAGDFTLTVDGVASTHPLVSFVSETGEYYAADGNTQESDSRPIQPKVVKNLDQASGAVHGVLLTAGTFVEDRPFDPVIARTVTGWDTDVDENQVSSEGFWPASPVTLRSLSTTSGADLQQTLVVVPGQFRAENEAGATVSGTERLWKTLSVRLQRSDSEHWAAPEIGAVRLYATSETTVSVSIEASDAVAGIGTIVVSRFDGEGFVSTAYTASEPHVGQYVVQVATPSGVPPEDLAFVVQVADRDGNVALSTGKGAIVHLVEASIGALAPDYQRGVPVLFSGRIPGLNSLAQPVSYVWDFGDGSTSSGSLVGAVEVDDSGAAKVPGEHAYSTAGTYLVRLTVSDALGGQGSAVSPVTVLAPATQWASYDTGISHTAAIKGDGTLWTWGSNQYGQLGTGLGASSALPAQVGGDSDWVSVATGANHTIAIKRDGSLYAWGNNDYGQIGNGTYGSPVYLPIRVGIDSDWAIVAGGHTHTLAIKRDGSLYAWGNNDNGRLGDGTVSKRLVPTRVGIDNDWAAIAGAYKHSVGIKTGGSLWAWGCNTNGQLGIGSTVDQWVPMQVAVGAPGWVSVACANEHNVAVMQGGTLWTWGGNTFGQLGDGTTTTSTVPVQVGSDTDWLTVGSGSLHQAAVKRSGELWTWGYNYNGQLGGTATPFGSRTPIRFGSASDYVSVACLGNHTAGLDRDGRLWMSGLNSSGELGNGDTIDRSVPTLVGPPAAETPVPVYAGQFPIDDPGGTGVYSMTVARDASICFADPGNNRIQHLDAAGTRLGVWGAYGAGASQFDMPFGVAAAPDGSVFVADTFGYRVQHFDAAGGLLADWGRAYGTGAGQFLAPYSLAVSPDGAIVYVADRDNDRIQRFSSGGAFIDTWGTPGTGDGQFSDPYGVTVSPDGSVYVADTSNNRIKHFSATGAFISTWGILGTGDGQFNAPNSVAVAPDRSVYVADTGNCRIQHFSATGTFLGTWGAYGSANGEFSTPRGVAVAPDGSVYVVDTNNHRIQHFTYTP